ELIAVPGDSVAIGNPIKGIKLITPSLDVVTVHNDPDRKTRWMQMTSRRPDGTWQGIGGAVNHGSTNGGSAFSWIEVPADLKSSPEHPTFVAERPRPQEGERPEDHTFGPRILFATRGDRLYLAQNDSAIIEVRDRTGTSRFIRLDLPTERV